MGKSSSPTINFKCFVGSFGVSIRPSCWWYFLVLSVYLSALVGLVVSCAFGCSDPHAPARRYVAKRHLSVEVGREGSRTLFAEPWPAFLFGRIPTLF